jgi:phosphatidylglycerophosphate synthase
VFWASEQRVEFTWTSHISLLFPMVLVTIYHYLLLLPNRKRITYIGLRLILSDITSERHTVAIFVIINLQIIFHI